jgi:hypothetical protein
LKLWYSPGPSAEFQDALRPERTAPGTIGEERTRRNARTHNYVQMYTISIVIEAASLMEKGALSVHPKIWRATDP